MSKNPNYVKYQPQPYRKPMPTLWWMQKKPYTQFMLRELTSIFVALYCLVLLFQARAIAQGAEAYDSFLSWLQSPLLIFLHFIALVFLLFHCFTWFKLTQKALVLRLGKHSLPGAVITATNFTAWIVLSILVAWIIVAAT